MREVLPFAVGYLVGSVSFGYLLVRVLTGRDIRTLGSGNVGATNVGRVLGRKMGLLVFFLDALKGFVPTVLFRASILTAGSLEAEHAALAAGLATVIGHMLPVFHGFRGGKGVATSAGFYLAVAPWPCIYALLVFGFMLGASKMVSLGSVFGAASLPFFVYWSADRTPAKLGIAILIALVILIRHRTNLRKIWRGEENKIGTRVAIETPAAPAEPGEVPRP